MNQDTRPAHHEDPAHLEDPSHLEDPAHQEESPPYQEERPEYAEPLAHQDAPTAPAAPAALAHPAEPPAQMWPEETVHGLQQRWREVQLRFVDDPRAAADEAETLVKEALDAFSASVAAQQQQLAGWRGDGADTEQMRMAVRGYRDLFDRLLAV
jgi:hypothetical protein